ncbi:MAG: glycosyltransferase family 2 protein [Candidatus Alcyoniella australis]|nr:glycosyltransferase family 2 protein [Candidatus Alcyoniella australis]
MEAQPSYKLSVIIPVYNSEPCLEELYSRLVESLGKVARLDDYEIIMVDDGSRDGSWDVVSALARRDPRLRGIQLSRNYGQHNALLRGIRAARHELIMTIDDDLQHPPESIPEVLDHFTPQIDVLYITPDKQQHGLGRDLASSITKWTLRSSMGVDVASQVSAWRVLRTSLRDAFRDYENSFVSIDVLLTWGTTRFAALAMPHASRAAGKSNYSVRKLIVHAMNMMTGFSTLPLQLASLIGFGFTLFGGCVLAYVIGRYLIQGTSVPGFPFLASIIAIFSGAQLFALGIIGEYLARMHFRTMGRPSSVVREHTGQG